MIRKTHVKLNFGLQVLRRREDGFHDIETLFWPCHAYGDTLEVIAGDDYSRTSASLSARYGGTDALRQGISADGRLMVTLAREEGADWDPLQDLTARAFRLLQEDFDLPPTKIFLEKTAPVGAGLGGGSADGAAALCCLNDLYGLGLDADALSARAARLGSDCAFFLHDRPMLGTGRGEVLTPFDLALDGYDLQVVVPEGIAVSTSDAYRDMALRGADRPSLKAVLSRPVETWKDLLVNDFETTVFARYPALAAIKASLYAAGAVYASMSGSGSALFALFRK